MQEPVFNQSGLDLLKHFEGCRLKAYQDSVGVWTIGWGRTEGVKEGMTVTQEEADKQLLDALKPRIDGVRRLAKADLSDNQFSALVCFAYNVGLENLKKSLLLRCVNTYHWEDAAKEFSKWNHAGGKVLAGLTRRRAAEASLFSKDN